jgi:hypothetical protein
MQTNVLKYFLLRKKRLNTARYVRQENVHYVSLRNGTKGTIHGFFVTLLILKTQIEIFIIRNIGTLGHLYPKKSRDTPGIKTGLYDVQDNGKVTKFATKSADQL